MLMYRAVARRPRAILKELRRHKKRHCPDHYYHVRDWFNQTPWTPGTDVTHAAAFIYLNKAAYSGIWRVNKSGHFNVPVAKTKNLSLPTNLVFHANALKRATIYDGFFWDDTLELADEGDFVYADPPYDGTYSSYTLEKFDDTEQVLLAKLLAKLADSGVKVLASNSDTPFIRRLYKSFTIERLPTRRRIGHKNVHELLMRKGY